MKTVIFGLSGGDEGKGRICALLVKDADWSIKFNGGNNSGHQVFDDNGVKHSLHHLTAGAVFGKKVAIDAGAVVNLSELKVELDNLRKYGHNINLYISENVHIIQPEHLEKDLDGSKVGSTCRGIAYVYADRVLRIGKRVTQEALAEYGIKATVYRGLPPIAKHENAIFEGSQGILLDIDLGEYPYVTSSSIMPSSVHRIDKFIGVFKTYTTRVGKTMITHPDIPKLRELGNEWGTTTGRPRNCYWNDLDQLDYAISVTQPDEIVVTKLDILKDMDDISVYRDNKLIKIGNLDTYKQFLLDTFPQIKWFSESPAGDLIKVR